VITLLPLDHPNISPWRLVPALSAQRSRDALATDSKVYGPENNVPQGGVVWVFAVKK
jgi:hypothetical protein